MADGELREVLDEAAVRRRKQFMKLAAFLLAVEVAIGGSLLLGGYVQLRALDGRITLSEERQDKLDAKQARRREFVRDMKGSIDFIIGELQKVKAAPGPPPE